MRQALQATVVHKDRQTDARTDKGTVESSDGQTDIHTQLYTNARTDRGIVESTDG